MKQKQLVTTRNAEEQSSGVFGIFYYKNTNSDKDSDIKIDDSESHLLDKTILHTEGEHFLHNQLQHFILDFSVVSKHNT